jgi:hypothetical protein
VRMGLWEGAAGHVSAGQRDIGYELSRAGGSFRAMVPSQLRPRTSSLGLPGRRSI